MEQTGSLFSFAKFEQLAYVARDLDEAMASFQRDFGIGKFMEMRNMDTWPDPGGPAKLDVALAWSGDVMIEIIVPRGGEDAFWRDGLPLNGETYRFHHLLLTHCNRDELDATRNRILARDIPIVSLKEHDGRVFFADMRSTMGHYVECFHLRPEDQPFRDMIPKN